MAYQIVSRGVELTDDVERHVLDKIGKIDKFLTDLPDDGFLLRIALSRNQANPHWADALLDLDLPPDTLWARGSASSPVHAVHLAVIDLERQLEERKEKLRPYISRGRKRG